MLWLYITILSYFLFASSSVADRYLLAGPLKHRRAATFYSGITGIWVVVLIPFGFNIPSFKMIGLSFVAGALGILWLWALYNALKYGFASTALPMIGAMTAVFTLFFGFIILGEAMEFSLSNVAAFSLMLTGSLLLSFRKDAGSRMNFLRALFAASVLGLVFVTSKIVFNSEGFINGLIWIQFGAFLSALTLLLSPHTREIIFQKNPIKKKKVWGAILVQKGAGGAGSALQKVAIWQAAAAELAFINALAGVQHFFVLLIAIILSVRHPELLKEELNKKTVTMRGAGILGVAIGLWLLFM